MKKIFFLVMILCFMSSFSFPQEKDQRLLPVKVNGKWGYIDTKGKVVITPQFDFASKFYDGLAIVTIGDKEGYIDQKGNLVIKPQYEMVFPFNDSLAAVQIGNLNGFINKKGEIVIQPKFYITIGDMPLKNGIAFVSLDSTYSTKTLIDKTGKVLTDLDVTGIISEGLIRGIKDSKYGFIDVNGKVFIKPQYIKANDFKEGVAVVSTVDGWGCIDKTGKYIVPIRNDWELGDGFSEGMVGVLIDNKWGFIDKTGNIKIKPQFDKVNPFSNGLASVEKDGKSGYIDKTGKIVVSISHLISYDFENGVARVADYIEIKEGPEKGELKKRWMFINKTGKQISKNMFYHFVYSLSDGIASVESEVNDAYKNGYVDKSGNIITESIFDRASHFKDGIAEVWIGDKIGYINKTGKYIWEPTE